MTIFHFKRLQTRIKAGLTFSFATLAISIGPAGADDIAVPSGQPLSFLEFISENDGDLVRFRFLAPQIGSTFSFEDVVSDFQAVCDTQVMPVLAANALTPRQIVLSMSAVDIPFGEVNPDVLQFFELFRPENGLCIWEEF